MKCKVRALILMMLMCWASLSSSQSTQAVQKFYQIIPGEGVEECKVGYSEECFIKFFGGDRHGMSLINNEQGIEAFVVKRKIKTLFFFLNAKKHGEFNGDLNNGISKKSTISDVINVFGAEGRYHKYDGLNEEELSYSKLNTSFTFVNNFLSVVIISAKKAEKLKLTNAQLESKLVGFWQPGLNAYTRSMPVEDAFLTGALGMIFHLNDDKRVNIIIPCEIRLIAKDKRIPSDVKGTWTLDETQVLSVNFDATLPDGKLEHVELKGALRFEFDTFDDEQMILKDDLNEKHLGQARLKDYECNY